MENALSCEMGKKMHKHMQMKVHIMFTFTFFQATNWKKKKKSNETNQP